MNQYFLYVEAVQNRKKSKTHKNANICTEIEILHPELKIENIETLNKLAIGEIQMRPPPV